MEPHLDAVTRKAVAQFERVDFALTVVDGSAVLLRTRLWYDLHVRPVNHIYSQLRDRGLTSRVSLRRVAADPWTAFEPLSVLAMALREGEAIELRVLAPVSVEALRQVIDTFRDCPVYRDYGCEEQEDKAVGVEATEELEQFRREFDAGENGSCLVKLNIENFVIGHLAEIEAYLLSCARACPSCGVHDCVDEAFGRLLRGEYERFGILSLDVAYDNLMQIRDMCYHQHFRQLEQRQKIPYSVMGIEWCREFGSSWRHRQSRRHHYFYERERDYYRELFLMLVTREKSGLRNFVERSRERLDYSLQLRRDLSAEMSKIEEEMHNFSPNFDNPEEFGAHIRFTCDMVVKDIGRLTPFVQLIRDQRIFCAMTACGQGPVGPASWR